MSDERMTVAELIEILQKMPGDIVVICDRYSDYEYQEPPMLVTVIVHPDGRFERFYPNQWKDKPLPRLQTFCHFKGN